MEASSDTFRIGPCTVSPSLNRVRRGDDEVRLEPKVMELLVALARRGGEVISRQELMELVWTDTIVSDDAINRSVSALRGALGDNPREPQFIETIPKRGYRLIAEVDWRVRGDSVPLQVPVLELSKDAPAPPPPVVTRPMLIGAVVVLVVAAAVWLRPRSVPPPLIPTPFTFDTGFENHPALSPDGNRIAYSRVPEGEQEARIFVGQVGDATRLMVSAGPGWESSPVWINGGTRLAFARYADTCEIWSVSALGGPARLLAPCTGSIYADLEAGAEGALYFNSRRDASQPFHIARWDNGVSSQVTSPPSGVWGDHDPVLSPDGTRLAFTRSASEGIQDLFVVDLGSGQERRVTSDARLIRGDAWRDNETVAFSSNRGGRQQIWLVPSDGGEPTVVPLADDNAQFPSIVGDRMAYVHTDNQTNIWQYDLATGEASPVVSSSGWDMHPHVSPDGTQLAFTSNRSGTYEVWISAIDGTGARQITQMNGPFTSRPRWSPDGGRILFASRPDRSADLFVVDVATGAVERLTETPWDELAASWSKSGTGVFFSSSEGGEWGGWRLEVASGGKVNLGQPGAMGLLDYDPGVFFARQTEPGLWLGPSDEPVQLVTDLDTRDWGSVALCGSTVYYYARRRGVVAFDFETRTDSVLWWPQFRVPGHDPALAVSPDGRVLYLGQVERSESDVMVAEW